MHNNYNVPFLFPLRSGKCCCGHNSSRYTKQNSNILHLNSIALDKCGVLIAEVCLLSSPVLTTTSEIIFEPRKERSTGGVIAVVVAAVIIGIAIMAALIGLFIYRRRNTHRVTQLTRMHPAGLIYILFY